MTSPVVPEVAELPGELADLMPPYDTVLGYHGDAQVAYLTFDDGPGPYTSQVLDILAEHGVLATFCQVGNHIDDYPETQRRLIAAGHTVCNHSWDHPSGLGDAPAEVIDTEIARTEQAFGAYGVRSHWFRAPGGDFGQTTVLRQVAQARGVQPLGWAVDSQDWRKPGVQAIVNNVMSRIEPGAIVLLHDAGGVDREQTVQALPVIIRALQDAGYQLASLPPSGLG
ncbi:putative polysaccharide deacetylase PdaA precursor (plasmid) [Variovorax sp. PBS-H4]|uniref:polysaccharide deacetylase family protein n=1 Tax=Variovorax sp. PBS-H4 TaxID=434008 RepID=UPI001315B35B|nr:polysaccharide deacetylase family protein [Variovorax sp. PBS-H4]VTU41433.1 putative polysaccharide deacetylase PdaA precursor [Variovorax sp. PBS-H4]